MTRSGLIRATFSTAVKRCFTVSLRSRQRCPCERLQNDKNTSEEQLQSAIIAVRKHESHSSSGWQGHADVPDVLTLAITNEICE